MTDKEQNLEEGEKMTSEKHLANCLGEYYVCWLDIMGMQKTMSMSLENALNFVLKLHDCITAIAKSNQSLYCYPVMDGAYVASRQLETLRTFIDGVYSQMAQLFLTETGGSKCSFIIRGAIAKGDILHGRSIKNVSLGFDCDALKNNTIYAKQLMVGMPMIQAYVAERNAPPFGVYIHESARAYGKLQGCYYEWWRRSDVSAGISIEELKQKVIGYFDWCSRNKYQLEMDEGKIERYKLLAEEYFGRAIFA